ncbi:thiamine pyrophosphate-binding protein [Ornithinibacillus gellani]|uniref:thiamine pyrophosphate-binding protein n=1 Tax=Ornithinibacillus gellani TaxID=2293253 RepID=UPI001CC1DA4E|nr:thiamine pyrophosphate-binding protein [Ornithinibacillus gellani]
MHKQIREQQQSTMTAAQAIVACMKLEGIAKVFCVPGESYLPVLDALYDESSIDVISARHEGAAAFMAEGYAKCTLKPGIVLATRGVGAANLSIGVHTAYQDSTPMVIFLGQVHRRFRGREGFQEVDLDQFFQPITKWAVEVNDPERMPEIVQRAFRIAQTGRPGPVVVSLPEDVLPKEASMVFGPPIRRSKPAPSNSEMKDLELLLSTARTPLLIAGGGVKLSGAEEQLVQTAEKLSIPVMAAFRRHDVFPNQHPLYAGHLGLGTAKEILETVQEADLILAVGTRLSEVTTQDYQLIQPEQKLVHIDIDDRTLGKVFHPHLGIVADAQEALSALNALPIDVQWHNWSERANEAYVSGSNMPASDSSTIQDQIITSIMERVPEDTIFTNDAGNFAGWLHAYYRFTKKHTYVGPTSGAMGYGLPAAIGAKLANQEKKVIAMAGDGGFMMTVQELETAVRYDIPIIALVFNNRMYGTIRMHQEMHYPEKVIATDLGDVSFVDMAKSLGADGTYVLTIDDFNEALDQALTNNRPTVIEIIIGKEQISVTSTIEQLRERAQQ